MTAGFFVAEPSQAAVALIKKDGGRLPEPRQRDTLWLVYKWEGLQPLALYPSAEQQLPVFFWAQGSDGQTRARFRMLRCGDSVPAPCPTHLCCSLVSARFPSTMDLQQHCSIAEHDVAMTHTAAMAAIAFVNAASINRWNMHA